MDVKAAAAETKNRVLECSAWPLNPKALARFHIIWMLDQIENKNVTGNKAHLWLGWAQAATLNVGAMTLEEITKINNAT